MPNQPGDSVRIVLVIAQFALAMTVATLAVIVGRSLLRIVSLHVLHFVGAGVCLLLATLTVVELVR